MNEKPFYIAAYDTESVMCLEGVRAITMQHLKYNVPATFFVVGELLEDKTFASEMKSLLDNPLFDVQSHTYTHFSVIPRDGSTPDEAFKQRVFDEIKRTNDILQNTFNKKIIGFRTPCGYHDGLGRNKWLLNKLWYEGIRFISSQLVGPGTTVPAPLSNPYWNETDILRPLLELPGHGWHDNVVKGYNHVDLSWPPIFPWGYPTNKPSSPSDLFNIHKHEIDYVFNGEKYMYYSPIMHPWSIHRFNENAETINLLLKYIIDIGMEGRKFSDVYKDIKERKIKIRD